MGDASRTNWSTGRSRETNRAAANGQHLTRPGRSRLVHDAGRRSIRSKLLSLDPRKLDARSQQYLAKVHKDIQSTSLESFTAVLSRAPGEQHLSDAEVLKRRDLMVKHFGVDDKTSPMAVLNSGLSDKVLVDKLTVIRSRTLFRLSDEALSDVEANNMLLVALRYRGK